MYRCIVIDDEPLALNVLADYIRQTDGLQLVDITTSPIKGLQRIQNNEANWYSWIYRCLNSPVYR